MHREIPASELQPGDRIVDNTGEQTHVVIASQHKPDLGIVTLTVRTTHTLTLPADELVKLHPGKG